MYVHPGVHHVWSQTPAYVLLLPTWKTFFGCFGDSGCPGSVTCQNGQKIHQDEAWVPSHGQSWHPRRPQRFTAVPDPQRHRLQCSEPPPVGKDPQSWVSSHSNLGFRTLSAPHNGPGDHSRQPPPPVSTLLGNGLFLPPLGVGWGHLQEGPVLVGSSDPGSSLSGKLETSALKAGRGLQPGRPKTEP